MKKVKKFLCFMFAAIIFLAGCSNSAPQKNGRAEYRTYKEIPGVTQDDIDAVDALITQRSSFVYGMTETTETFFGEDGSVEGFTALLCGRMTELFGIEFEPRIYAWDALVEKMESHEIDFSGDFSRTPERLKKYYMTDPVAHRTLRTFRNGNAENLSKISKERPVRCAFLDGSIAYAHVADSWDIPFEPVFVGDSSKFPELLMNGEIDAVIEESVIDVIFDEYDSIISENYYPLEFSPVSVTTADPGLEPVITVMQKYLDNGGYSEITEMYNRGERSHLKYKLSKFLTDEEKEYVKQHGTEGAAVLAACETDTYPLSFYNARNKKIEGIAVDVLDEVAALTGLVFKTGNEPDAKWAELLEGLESGKYSIVTELLQTTQRQDRFLWSDEPYSTDTYAMISRADYPDSDVNQILSSKIGLIEDSGYSDVFLEWFPSAVDTVTYEGSESAFNALEKGEIDLLMATQNMLLNLTNYLEKPGFKINYAFNYLSDSYFGFNKNEEILRSVVSKALRYVNTEKISESWQRKVFDYQGKMLKDMVPYFIIFAALLLIAFSVVFVLYMKNRQINKNLEKLVEKRTNEVALQTSTLTTVFDSIPDLVFCKDLTLKFTRCNRSFENHFNCREGDIVGKDDESALGLPAEMAEGFREADRAVIRGGRTAAVEEIIPSANGEIRLFETIKTPLMQNSEAVGIMGISRDITQRKTLEETIKLTLDNLDTCIYINEIDTGEILFINDKMAKEFGGGDFNGKVCWHVLQKDFTERCDFCPIHKLTESGDDYYIWEEHNTVTGRYYKNTDSLIKWHDGRLVHMQHSVDITDNKIAQFALDRRLKQQSLMTSISQSFLSDADIDTLIANALHMTGEFMGIAQILFYKLEGDGNILKCQSEWLNGELGLQTRIGEKLILEGPLLSIIQNRSNEKGFCLNSNDPNLKLAMAKYRVNFQNYITTPIFLNGSIYAALDFSREDDGREWSDSDINLATLVSNLLSGLFERHLMESELITAKELAEQGSRSKSDFLSRMSHEIRTPLNAIIGMIGIAMNTNDMEKIRHCHERANSASKHLLGVINDILDMSKIEADKFELDCHEFDFEKMLMNITNVTNFRAEEKKQNFIVSLNKNVPAVIMGDELRLSQIITNLLTNAVKFTPEGGAVKLNISKTEDSGDDVVLRIEVEDTGIGISKEQQSRLFTSFEQAEGSTTRKFGGTGLGLAISKRIVEMMGGSIWIESELGQGSKFIFTIKARKGSEKTRTKLSEKIDRDKLRILAVDDSYEIRDYFTHVMESLGLTCEAAAGGAEALDLIKNCGDKPYNMFFVDWQMPEMNGIELTRRIKEIYGDNSVVFMISVAEWGNIEKEAIAAGVKAFISKPLFPSTLLDAINECLAPEQKKDNAGSQDSGGGNKWDFSGHTILLAEDVEINREIMSVILEDTGVSVDFAEDGRSAVTMFQNNPDKYSLILMDIHMPEMDGYEATRTIRALDFSWSKNIPIIAMTANVFKEDVEHCLEAGMNDHTGKPVDPVTLFGKLDKYLKQKI